MGEGIAAVAVNSLERGFQGENLSVDGWGLLQDWGLRRHLQFKQLGEQDGFFTFGAVAAETQSPFEDVALVAPTVADRALAAQAAFVHGCGPPARRADGVQRATDDRRR